MREHEEKKDRVIEKYKTKCEQKRVRTLTVIIKNILLNSLSNHQFSLLHRGHRNNNFARASRFFVHFFASTARLRRSAIRFMAEE